MDTKDSINAVEVVLRDLIEKTLGEQFGSDWIEQSGVTPERIEGWRRRKAEEAKRRDGTVLEEGILQFSDFTDLKVIIEKHWALFKSCFGERKTFDVYMSRLEDFRNPEMHSRALLPFETALVEGITGEIRNKVTLFQSGTDDLDRHFPRIEQVRDSFGNTASGTGWMDRTNDTGLVLHPGDTVIFECSSWDPAGLVPTWRMSRRLGETIEQEGSQTTFRWDIEESEIAGLVVVRFTLTSPRPYHREGSDDGDVSLQYKVLPR